MRPQENLCHVVQPILLWGMVLSLLLMFTGLLMGLAMGVEDTNVVPLMDIPSGMLDLDPPAFLTAGLVLLIATPLARVLGALCVFLKEKDHKFVLISLTVLLMVVAAVMLGAS
jgi:uncharacterized membrane protein